MKKNKIKNKNKKIKTQKKLKKSKKTIKKAAVKKPKATKEKNKVKKKPQKKSITITIKNKKEKAAPKTENVIEVKVIEPKPVNNVEFNIDIGETVKQPIKDPSKETPSMYWTKETENYIIQYNLTDDLRKKTLIYQNHLKLPFEKLVENVINTYKFSYFETDLEDAKKECLNHLLANIHRFTEEKGKGKSFGYFSVTAKNHFILVNNSNHKRWKMHENIDPTPEHPKEFVVDDHVKQKVNDKKEFIELMIEYWEKNIKKIFNKQRDIQIAYAILELFRKCDLDSYNKKALYLYVRGQHECKTQQITKIINKMKSHQRIITNDYLNYGKILDKSDIRVTLKEKDLSTAE